MKALQHLDYQVDDLVEYRSELIYNILEDISNINRDPFSTNMRIHIIDKYSDKEVYPR